MSERRRHKSRRFQFYRHGLGLTGVVRSYQSVPRGAVSRGKLLA